ncbi:DnaJ domain-containing protein [Bradyrhizobium sp. Pear77]|nr:DnaJ domain-containing protein [Bradyrhizobium altum]
MSKRDSRGYYAILRVSLDATAAKIKAAYRHRAKELHPDRNRVPGRSAQFRLLNEAYEALNDPASRATYDTMALETADAAPARARLSKAMGRNCLVNNRV